MQHEYTSHGCLFSLTTTCICRFFFFFIPETLRHLSERALLTTVQSRDEPGFKRLEDPWGKEVMDRRRSGRPGAEYSLSSSSPISKQEKGSSLQPILSQSGQSTEFPALGTPSGRGRPRQELLNSTTIRNPRVHSLILGLSQSSESPHLKPSSCLFKCN